VTFLLNVKICSSKLDALTEAKHTEGLEADCDKFCAEGNCLYERCIVYLKKWMQPMEEFSCYMQMALNDTPQWSTAELSPMFLIKKKGVSNDVKYSDQFINLKKFLAGCKDNEEFFYPTGTAQFFTVPSHNAQASRIFSFMKVQ